MTGKSSAPYPNMKDQIRKFQECCQTLATIEYDLENLRLAASSNERLSRVSLYCDSSDIPVDVETAEQIVQRVINSKLDRRRAALVELANLVRELYEEYGE